MSRGKKTTTVLPYFLGHMRFYKVWPKLGEEYGSLKDLYRNFFLLMIPVFLTSATHAIQICRIIPHHLLSTEEITVDVSELISVLGCSTLVIGFVSQIPKLRKIFDEYSTFSGRLTLASNPNEFRSLERYNLYEKWWQYYTNIAVSIVTLSKLFLDPCGWDFDKDRRLCGLMFNAYLPFDYNFVPLRQIVFAIQLYGFLYVVKIGPAAAFGILEWTQYVIIRIRVFKTDLEQFLAVPRAENEWRMGFYQLVREHCELIRLATELKNCYKIVLFTHFAMTSSIVGMCLFVIIRTSSPTLLGHFIGWLIILSVACIASEDLINESLQIGDIIYNSKWYEMPINHQKELQLMLISSQRPLILESCSFSQFSLSFLLTMMRASYSYITLLMKISSK